MCEWSNQTCAYQTQRGLHWRTSSALTLVTSVKEQWYWSTRRWTMEVSPLNAACNTGVMPFCTYGKHSKIIYTRKRRASKDSDITTGQQHKTWMTDHYQDTTCTLWNKGTQPQSTLMHCLENVNKQGGGLQHCTQHASNFNAITFGLLRVLCAGTCWCQYTYLM